MWFCLSFSKIGILKEYERNLIRREGISVQKYLGVLGEGPKRQRQESKKMSKIFQDDWEAAGPEVLAVARAKLAAFIEILKTQACAQ
jgi:hypothetical protein